MRLKGKVSKLETGQWKQGVVWKGQTNLTTIEVGGQLLQNIVLPDDLKETFKQGDEVELMILPFNGYEKTICGVRANGQTKKCGASYQLAIGLVSGILFGWLVLPIVVAVISLKAYLEIDSF